MEGQTSLLSV